MLRDMVDKISATGANVIICEKGIDDMAQHFLARRGILAGQEEPKNQTWKD